jgi:O-antigen ligase
MPSSTAFIPDPARRWDRTVLYGILALLLFGILAFGATEPWSIFVLRVGAILLLLTWGVGRLVSSDPRILLPRLFLPCAAFVVLVAAQWAGLSTYRYATMVDGMNYVAFGILMFLVIQCLRSDYESRAIVVTFAIFAGAASLEAIIQSLTHTSRLLFLRQPRVAGMVYGSYVNHNHYAGMMEMMAPFLLAWGVSDRLRGPQRVLVGAAGLVAAASIILSQSRGGMLALLCELLFFAVIALPKAAARRTLQFSGVALVLFGALLAWLGGSAIAERFSSIGDVSANQMRIDVAKDSVRMFLEHPMLGYGLGTFPVVYPEYRTFWTAFFVNQAHDDWVQLLVETGVIGFGIAIWYLMVLYRRAVPRAQEHPLHSWSAIAALGALTGITGLLVHSFFDFNLHVPANAALFFFLGGLAVGAARGQTPAKQPSKRPAATVGVTVN